MNKLIAVVDDEEDTRELISVTLRKNDFVPREFAGAKGLFNFLTKEKPALIILDIMMPDMDGFEICKQLKNDVNYSRIPVIMLTAKADESDKVVGLEIGGDDYITKPFSVKELVARIKAVLRRNDSKLSDSSVEVAGILKIFPENYSAEMEGRKIELTTAEFKILNLLVLNRGKVFSRALLLDHLWENEKIVIDRTIDVHVSHLKKKLGKAGLLIKNIRGVGYKLEE